MKQTSFTLYFFALGILFIILDRLQLFTPGLLAKAVIIPFLMYYYHLNAKGSYSLFHRLIMIGLLFSWFGDIFFYLSNNEVRFYFSPDTWFLTGLSAMLLSMVFYTTAFLLRKGKNTIFNRRIYQLVLVILYGLLFMWFIYNHLDTETGNFRLPVIVYAVALLAMLTAALNRYGKVNGVSYMLVVIAALLFVVSNSMLAINMFYGKFDFARILIMATYITAQYFIAVGCLRRDFDLNASMVVA